MTDNERMTDEHAAYHLLTDAAIKEGKATVNELADAEEAGRQISIGELMARIGDDKAAALLNPNNIEETKAKYEAIEQKMKILRDQLRDPAFTEQLAAAAQRFEVIRPFMDTLAEVYGKDSPIWEAPIPTIIGPIDLFILDNGKQQDSEEDKRNFLAFFASYLKEWETFKAPPEGLEEGQFNTVWERLYSQGIVKTPPTGEGTTTEAEIIKAAELLAEARGYSLMLQGPITNAFARQRATPKAPGKATIDEITGIATILAGDFRLTIQDFNELTRGLGDTAHMLFDELMKTLTRAPSQSGIITIPLREYMDKRGLKDEKEARKQIAGDIDAIKKCEISGPKGYGKNRGEGLTFTLYGGEGFSGIMNSIIYFTISPIFNKLLRDYKSLMPYPDGLMKIRTASKKHAYPLGRYIFLQKHINAGKPRENLISIKALTAACPSLPRYEELDTSKGEISRKIMDPFFDNLNYLTELGLFTYRLCHNKGAALSQEEEEAFNSGQMTYAQFIALHCLFTFKEYPTQTRRIETRKKHEAAARRANDRAKNKALQQKADKKAGLSASPRSTKKGG